MLKAFSGDNFIIVGGLDRCRIRLWGNFNHRILCLFKISKVRRFKNNLIEIGERNSDFIFVGLETRATDELYVGFPTRQNTTRWSFDFTLLSLHFTLCLLHQTRCSFDFTLLSLHFTLCLFHQTR